MKEMKVRGLSLAAKVGIFFVLVIALSGVGMVDRVKRVHEQDLLANARHLSRVVRALVLGSEELGGLWSASPGKVRTVDQVAASANARGRVTLYRLHDPDLARFLMDLARPVGAEVRISFKERRTEETWALKGDGFVYQSPIKVTRACIACHRETKAPPLKKGQVAGTIFVSFPGKGFGFVISSIFTVWGILALIFVIVCLYGLVRFELINPILDLIRKVHDMSMGNLDVDFGVKGLREEDTRDEVLKLAIAMERLRKSQKTMEKMLDDDSLEL